MPLWPTTPFVLLAAGCYSRGSERFRHWLENHRWFGPPLKAWKEHGAISWTGKALSAVGLLGSVAIMTTRLGLAWGVVSLAVALVVISWIMTRPAPPKRDAAPNDLSRGLAQENEPSPSNPK